MSRTITVAENGGFCAGVKRAIELAEKAARVYGEVFMLGDIVHNETVVRQLAQQGVRVVSEIALVPPDRPLLLRSHGTPRPVLDEIQRRGLTVIDATCPLVLEIHQRARQLQESGYSVIIIGDPGHEEIEAIASQIDSPLIVSDVAVAERLAPMHRAGIVVQSTQALGRVADIVRVLATKIDDMQFHNTICQPTRKRQKQVYQLAQTNDLMIVVGSPNSANTKRLTEIARSVNPNTYKVLEATELQPAWFEGVTRIGIASGASTPAAKVAEIVKKVGQLP